MYWQFLPCHVSGTRVPVIIEHEKGWLYCTHNMDVRVLVPPPSPPLPFRPLRWCFPAALTPWVLFAAPVMLGYWTI